MTGAGDPVSLLEKLRQESKELIPSKGLFSEEFKRWHATAIAVLRECFEEDDIIFKDFRQLQFECPLEVLESFYASHVGLFTEGVSAQIEARKDQWFVEAQERHFQKAMDGAREILLTAIVSLKSK